MSTEVLPASHNVTPGNPFTFVAGNDLDQMIHEQLFGQKTKTGVPAYSSDDAAANAVVKKLKEIYRGPIIIGQTKIRRKPWFARHDSDPSTSTEALAETRELAICRLAMVMVLRNYPQN